MNFKCKKKIVELKEKYFLKNIINFGASDGFHVIGLLKNKFYEKCIAFENNEKNLSNLIDNVNQNNLESQFFFERDANFRKIKKYLNENDLNKTIFLCDIEGEEYNIFNEENLNYFKNSFLIIEDHNFLINDKTNKETFYENLKKNHKIEILKNSSRNPYDFQILDELSDDDRWLLMSEGRSQNMNWIICIPKISL